MLLMSPARPQRKLPPVLTGTEEVGAGWAAGFGAAETATPPDEAAAGAFADAAAPAAGDAPADGEDAAAGEPAAAGDEATAGAVCGVAAGAAGLLVGVGGVEEEQAANREALTPDASRRNALRRDILARTISG
jgi:hypothetical protein